MDKKFIAAAACVMASGLAFPLSATAQNEAGHQWTLQECVDYAKANNIEVKTGLLNLEEAEATTSNTTGQLLPSLSFSTGHNLGWRPWSQSTVNLEGGTMTTTESDVTYNGNYALSANWTVWDGGRTRKERESYRLAEKNVQAANEKTVNTIQEQIVQYYVQILYEAEAVKVADSTLAASKLLRDRGKEMVQAGQMARVDLAQLEAQASQDEYSLVSAKAQLASYKLQLKQILELTGSQDFDVAIPEIDDSKVLAAIPSIEEVYAAALASRPEVQQSNISIEQAHMQEYIAKAGRYPTIGLSAGVSTSHSSASNDNVGTQIKQNVNNSIGLNINVPILDNRSTRTNKAKAKIQVQQSELDKLQTEKDIYKQVETYWLDANSAQAQYSSAISYEQSMSESFDLVSEQFGIGLKNIAELTTGKSNLLSARQQLLQSKYTALLNIALLHFYAGEGLSL